MKIVPFDLAQITQDPQKIRGPRSGPFFEILVQGLKSLMEKGMIQPSRIVSGALHQKGMLAK